MLVSDSGKEIAVKPDFEAKTLDPILAVPSSTSISVFGGISPL